MIVDLYFLRSSARAQHGGVQHFIHSTRTHTFRLHALEKKTRGEQKPAATLNILLTLSHLTYHPSRQFNPEKKITRNN